MEVGVLLFESYVILNTSITGKINLNFKKSV